eukprot:6689798-Pyramimonas_sp.AAC.1
MALVPPPGAPGPAGPARTARWGRAGWPPWPPRWRSPLAPPRGPRTRAASAEQSAGARALGRLQRLAMEDADDRLERVLHGAGLGEVLGDRGVRGGQSAADHVGDRGGNRLGLDDGLGRPLVRRVDALGDPPEGLVRLAGGLALALASQPHAHRGAVSPADAAEVQAVGWPLVEAVGGVNHARPHGDLHAGRDFADVVERGPVRFRGGAGGSSRLMKRSRGEELPAKQALPLALAHGDELVRRVVDGPLEGRGAGHLLRRGPLR